MTLQEPSRRNWIAFDKMRLQWKPYWFSWQGCIMGTLSQGERRKQAEAGGKCRGLGHRGAQWTPLIASDKHNAVTVWSHFMRINCGTEDTNLEFTEIEKTIWVVQDLYVSTQSLTVHFTKNQWHLFKFTSQLKFFFQPQDIWSVHANRSTSSECFYDGHKPCFHFYRCTESGMYQTVASSVGSIVSFEKWVYLFSP